MAPSTRGVLIVVEGLDRSGKSTQVARLAQRLSSGTAGSNSGDSTVATSARVVKFPERTTTIGQMINSYLTNKTEVDDRAIHLLFSANRWELVPSILKDLEAGTHVICDRYAFSGIAYSCAKGLPFRWCLEPDAGLPLPDLTLFLSLSPEAAAQRGAYGEERYEVPALQAKVRKVFEDIGELLNKSSPSAATDVTSTIGSQASWTEIDAGRTVDEVEAELWKHVQAAVQRARQNSAPVGKLFTDNQGK